MTRILTVLFLSLVFESVLCEEESETASSLAKEIKKTQEEKLFFIKENKRLEKEKNDVVNKCHKQIEEDAHRVETGEAETDHQQRIIESLYRKLMRIKAEENEIKSAHTNALKLQLGILVMHQNIDLLNHRRSNGLTKKCLHLEKLDNGTEGSQPLTLSRGRLDETIVLKNKLRLERTKLAGTRSRNKRLRDELKAVRKTCQNQLEDLKVWLRDIGKNTKTGEALIERLTKELAEQRKVLADLIKHSVVERKNLNRWKKEARKVLKKYEHYFLEIICYGMLMRDVEALVEDPTTDSTTTSVADS